jgi:hypothetical protein
MYSVIAVRPRPGVMAKAATSYGSASAAQTIRQMEQRSLRAAVGRHVGRGPLPAAKDRKRGVMWVVLFC